jgi:hypothetical protein
MCKSTGCCGSLFRAILIIVNLVVFLIGAAIFALGAVLKFSPDLAKVLEISEVSSVLSPVLIFLLAFGAFLLLVSVFGLIGSCCGNRCFLVLYEIVIGLLLVTHLIVFVLMLIMADSVKGELKSALQKGVKNVEDYYDSLNVTQIPEPVPANITDQIKDKCKYYTIVATFIQCCDFNSSYTLLMENCCDKSDWNASTTCIDKVFNPLDKYTDLILYVPNGVALGIELVIFVAVIYIIVKINKYKNYKEWDSTIEMKGRGGRH